MGFIQELKRRHVVRVAIVYAVVATGTWQVADVAFNALGLPDYALTILIVLAIGGFPLALVLAWAYDLTPQGVRRAELVPREHLGADTEQAAPDSGRVPGDQTSAPASHHPESPSADSVAVLPFMNMSSSQDDQYFCDGMTEELINALAQVESLQVAARTSSFAYRDRHEDIRGIGQSLGVGTVLEGSVRRSGERLRVTVQLINVNDGYHLWSGTFDREVKDTFAIQDEIARAVVATLATHLGTDPDTNLVQRGTDDLLAYESYLRGRYTWNRRTEGGLRASITHFQEAIEKDADYANAYAGLADSHALLGIAEYGMAPPLEVMPRAKAAARQALRIDPRSAAAQTTLAHVTYAFDWDWVEADQAFRLAIELDPDYAFGHHWYALFLSAMERHDEAIASELRARELEPLSLIINKNVGTILFYAGQVEEAVREYRRTLELEPTFARTHYFYGLALEAQGRLEEAIREFRIALDADPGNTVLRASLGHALGLAGYELEASEILRDFAEIERQGRYVPALNRAIVALGMGHQDEALSWLERACEERSSWLVSARVDPTFDAVRDHPRFVDLMDRVFNRPGEPTSVNGLTA